VQQSPATFFRNQRTGCAEVEHHPSEGTQQGLTDGLAIEPRGIDQPFCVAMAERDSVARKG